MYRALDLYFHPYQDCDPSWEGDNRDSDTEAELDVRCSDEILTFRFLK